MQQSPCRNIVRYLILPALICLCCASPLYAKDFSGVWSNGKGEFKTFAVSLRKDGRGTLSTAIFSAPLRWEHKDDGIRIRASLDNRVSEMFLFYNQKQDVFFLKKGSEDSAELLKKISDEEPPDVEAEIMRSEEEKRAKNVAGFKFDKTVLNSRPELIADLVKRMRQFDGTGMYYVNVYPEGQEAHLQVTYVNYHLSVSVRTLYLRVEKPNVTATDRRPLPEPPDLPTRFRMAEDARQALERQLKAGDYKFSLDTVIGRSMWEVESYRQELEIHPDKDREKIVKIVEYIVNETFREWPGPYVITTPDKKK